MSKVQLTKGKMHIALCEKMIFSRKEPMKKQNWASYDLRKAFAKPTSDKDSCLEDRRSAWNATVENENQELEDGWKRSGLSPKETQRYQTHLREGTHLTLAGREVREKTSGRYEYIHAHWNGYEMLARLDTFIHTGAGVFMHAGKPA